jgi:hypothetical protein
MHLGSNRTISLRIGSCNTTLILGRHGPTTVALVTAPAPASDININIFLVFPLELQSQGDIATHSQH